MGGWVCNSTNYHSPITHSPLMLHSPPMLPLTQPPTHTHPLTHPLTTHSPSHPFTHTHPLTPHLSVFKDKQPGVVPGPWREAHMVHLISILAHTKVEPCKRTETQQPTTHSGIFSSPSSSQHQMLREGRSELKSV